MTLRQKIMFYLRSWRQRQARYEYLEQKHEENMEVLICGLGILTTVAVALALLFSCGKAGTLK